VVPSKVVSPPVVADESKPPSDAELPRRAVEPQLLRARARSGAATAARFHRRASKVRRVMIRASLGGRVGTVRASQR
jgi:hypothetical protein